MKNLILLVFFSITSLLSLVVLIILALLPKLCCCFSSFCNKNYKAVKRQNTRARRIKRARLRVLYKSQITKERPIQIELDRSEGLFFDKDSKQKIKDEESLENFYSGQYKTSQLSAVKQKMNTEYSNLSNSTKSLLNSMFSSVGAQSRTYLGQVRSYVMSSVTKYLNH